MYVVGIKLGDDVEFMQFDHKINAESFMSWLQSEGYQYIWTKC